MKCCIVLILFLLGISLAGCQTVEPDYRGYLPAVAKDTDFGMSLSAFRAAFPGAVQADHGQHDFRQVWIRENLGAGVDLAVYYFDTEGPMPMYEIILNYADPAARDRWAAANLGKPNHPNGKEWIFPTESGWDLNIWTYQNKLIFAASMPGTEWDEDGDGKMDG